MLMEKHIERWGRGDVTLPMVSILGLIGRIKQAPAEEQKAYKAWLKGRKVTYKATKDDYNPIVSLGSNLWPDLLPVQSADRESYLRDKDLLVASVADYCQWIIKSFCVAYDRDFLLEDLNSPLEEERFIERFSFSKNIPDDISFCFSHQSLLMIYLEGMIWGNDNPSAFRQSSILTYSLLSGEVSIKVFDKETLYQLEMLDGAAIDFMVADQYKRDLSHMMDLSPVDSKIYHKRTHMTMEWYISRSSAINKLIADWAG